MLAIDYHATYPLHNPDPESLPPYHFTGSKLWVRSTFDMVRDMMSRRFVSAVPSRMIERLAPV
jgi:hypothetical protein